MADGKVEIEIGADSSEFQKEIDGLSDKAKDGLKGLGNETDKAKDKFTELTTTIAKQETELTKLRTAYAQAVLNYGKNSTEAQELKAKMESLNDELAANKKEMAGAENAAKKLSGALDETAESSGVADVAMGTFIADGVKALISAAGDAIGSLMGLADATREYREDMAKLQTAFTTSGHSAEAAKGVYSDFYKILGESDRSVEAANHLAELTSNEQELAKWSDIAAGVTAKFGDSLPIEGLTEAANETAKVGQVTGPLADALNWAAKEGQNFGVTLKEQIPFTEKSAKELKYMTEAQIEEYEATKAQYDEIEAWNAAVTEAASGEELFNLALSKCTTEQERATLITETLNGMYADAAAEYNELTASTQDAREATMNMEEAQANIGKAIEPVTTAWTNLKTEALEAITPAIEWVSQKIQELTTWLREHETAATIIKGVLVGIAAAIAVLVVAFGGLMIVQTVSKAFTMLGAAMTGAFLPVTLIIAGVAALVAGFIYLWNNCEGFRAFWIKLWEILKAAASTAWAAIVSFFSEAWEVIKSIWDLVSPYFSAIWETIKNIFAVVKAVLSGNFSDAWEAIRRIIDTWSGYFSQVWTLIKGVFAAVGSWFGEKFRAAYTAITNIWDSISGYFKGLYDDILGVFANIKESFTSVGSNIVSGIWSGISAGYSWITGKISGWVSDVLQYIKNAFGIKSPSRVMRDEVGKYLALGVGEGFTVSMGDVTGDIGHALQGNIKDMTATVRATVASENAKAGGNISRPYTGYSELAQAIGMQTAGINSLGAEYRRGGANKRPIILQLDKRELGRAIVDTGGIEETRRGTKIITGGAYA